jgi:lipopolysaccharide export system permease protein
MKKILFRKILLDYMSFFLIALFSASIVIWVFQAVNYLDLMIEDGRDYKVYVSYSLLNFPKIVNRLFPFVMFFSLFHILTKYENSNELIIFWTFGISKLNLINFIFKFSIILMLVQIILSSLIVPKTRDMARNYLKTSKVNFFGNFVKPKKFNDTIKNVTIYSEKKDLEGNLYNLYLKKETNTDNFEITYAKKGQFKEINGIPILVLFDGATINSKNSEITNFSFSKSDFPLNNFESNNHTYQKTQELTSLELIKCAYFFKSKNDVLKKKIINCIESNLTNIYKEIYKRLVVPFYIPVLVLTSLLLTITSKENKNYIQIKICTFLIGLFFIVFSETTIKMISNKILNNFTISFLPIFFLLILYLIFFKKNNFKSLIK